MHVPCPLSSMMLLSLCRIWLRYTHPCVGWPFLLQVNTTLQTVEFSVNNIGDDGAVKLADVLQVYHGMAHSLRIHSLLHSAVLWMMFRLPCDIVCSRFLYPQANTTITAISMYKNKMTDVGGEAWADMLRINTSITEVDVSENPGMSQALVHRINALAAVPIGMYTYTLDINTSITDLDVDMSRVLIDRVNALTSCTLNSNTSITDLDVDMSQALMDRINALASVCTM